MSTQSDGPHQAVSVEGWNHGVGTTHDPLPDAERGGTVATIGGPADAELTKIGQDIARAYATHDMPPGALSALLGGLLAVAGGPFGRASQHAVESLRNAQRAVNR
jgi:hypothetical protein